MNAGQLRAYFNFKDEKRKSMSEDFKWTDELVLEFARFTNHDAPTFQGRYSDLEQFKQSKQNSNKVQYLFKTVDGKNIFEGDEYWYVDVKESSSPLLQKYTATQGGFYGDMYANKTFSTQAEAKEHVVMNKRFLSLSDLISVWADADDGKYSFEYYLNTPLFLAFKEIVNEKINAINR